MCLQASEPHTVKSKKRKFVKTADHKNIAQRHRDRGQPKQN